MALLLLGVSVPLLSAPEPALSQATVRLAVDENFRREPQGQILGRINSGTPLRRVGVQGSWTEATVEGWIWTASLQTTEREGMDLLVSAGEDETVKGIQARLKRSIPMPREILGGPALSSLPQTSSSFSSL